MKTSQQKGVKLWKNQRIIDQNGLIKCEQRERLFENTECVYLFEDLLKIYQKKGLGLHYMKYSLNKSEQTQTITYKAYVDFRCPKRIQLKREGTQRIIGEFFVHYRIIRFDKDKIDCRFPYLLLFDAKCGQLLCPDCQIPRLYRITQSSLFVIRTQFIYQIMRKLSFMDKYPNYVFTPHSFISTASNGETVYEYVKDHNYEPSYYYELCEAVLVNSLRLEMLKREMDCEVMRVQDWFNETEDKPVLLKHSPLFKLKYMCMKCPGKEIWTTREIVDISFCVLELKQLFNELVKITNEQGKKMVFTGNQIEKKYKNIDQSSKEKLQNNPEEKLPIQRLFKTQERRLDRSIQSEVQEYEQFEKQMKGIGRWHENLSHYKWPYLVLYQIKVPKMSCRRCSKQKEGLIYITNLIDEAHSILNGNIIRHISEMHNKQPKTESIPDKLIDSL